VSANFDFITDEQLRAALEADYAELTICIEGEAWKAALVISGSIVEALLVDYLITSGQKKPDPLKMELGALIERCQNAGALSSRAADLSSVVRSYRNLIHPGRLVRLKETYSEDDATVAYTLVGMITREIADKQEEVRGLTAEQIASKFFGDETALAIAPHLLQDVRPDQLERFLITVLPERLVNKDLLSLEELLDQGREDAISGLYRAAFDIAPTRVRRAATKKLVSVLKEGTTSVVQAYEDRLFIATDLQYVVTRDRPMVIAHLLSRISTDVASVPTVPTVRATKGITKYLNGNETSKYAHGVLRVVAYTNNVDDAHAVSGQLVSEFYNYLPDEQREPFRKAVDRWIPFLEQKGLGERVAIIKSTKSQIAFTDDDIPF
jgi:hypothetical protein